MIILIKNYFEKYKNEILKEIRLLETDKKDDAVNLYLSVNAGVFKTLLVSLQNVSTNIKEHIAEINKENDGFAAWAANGAYVVFLFIVLLFFWVNHSFKKTITNPITEVTAIAESISAGDLSVRVKEINRKDEVGKLIASLNKMIKQLNLINGTLNDKISELTSTSAEVNSTISELSSSISETSSSLSETTATVEEVQKTVQVSSDKAEEAVKHAEKVVQQAEKGRSAIKETLTGVETIKEQMQVIGKNILQLTEQSHAIGEIISSVSDIAEQSNLLAVNASIEAARAGEHGKGFVVVAHEIKNLADQSKQATGKVKTLLNEIQNSINSTIMATEKGEKIVKEQSAIAEISGAAIDELSEGFNDMREIIGQSQISSREQSIGMDQITEAMENIKTAGEQNAAGINQLKEASESILSIGRSLEDIVAMFKV